MRRNSEKGLKRTIDISEYVVLSWVEYRSIWPTLTGLGLCKAEQSTMLSQTNIVIQDLVKLYETSQNNLIIHHSKSGLIFMHECCFYVRM